MRADSSRVCLTFLVAFSAAVCGVALLTNFWAIYTAKFGSLRVQNSLGLLDQCEYQEDNGKVTKPSTCVRMQEIDPSDGSKNAAFVAGRLTYWILIGAIAAGVFAFVVSNFSVVQVFSPRFKAFLVIALCFLHAGGVIAAWVVYSVLYFNSSDFKKKPDASSSDKIQPSVSFYAVVVVSAPAICAFLFSLLMLRELKSAETVHPRGGKEASSEMGDE
eukprot:a841648_637.p1 GENE.a841648_637~~a841648_637.p1  ORF type:complete len:227 (+),score=63.22 a841648_637:32-682(+)